MASSSKKKEKKQSRFDRVRQILNEAQGDTVPDYQGYHAFWQDYNVLLTVTLYGQRMIVPPVKSSGTDASVGNHCCHCGPPSTADADDTAVGQEATSQDVAGLAQRAVAMFSPDESPTANCFPTGGNGGGGSTHSTTRSDQSGLIIGLRGEAPFDGSVFPPLLWQAARPVTDAEIAFIAAWIDDGCPPSDAEDATKTAAVRTDERVTLAHGDAAHPVSDGSINADREAVQALKVRKNVSCLNAEELHRLRAAIACMSEYDGFWLDERSYDYWARIHTNSCQHGWEQFLPWHRLYLYFFEQHLQDYDPLITLPYWSWSQYAAQNNLETEQLDTGVLPEAYRCWTNEDAVERLAALENPDGERLFSSAEIRRLKKLTGQTKNSGLRFLEAAQIPYTVDTSTGTPRWSSKVRAIYDELVSINPLWFPDRWPGTLGGPAQYPTPQDIEALLNINSFPVFGGGPSDDHHFGALEETHNGMHNFSGGMNPNYAAGADPQALENPQYGYMTENRTTAFDPIFWAHHSNVDRLWAQWQVLHPSAEPQDLDGNLPPWPLAVRDALSTTKLGYEYVKDVHHYVTSPDVAMVRFHGVAAPVQPTVSTTFRKAEVRLHRVRRGDVENAFLRVFLNAPDADASTATRGHPNFAGQTATFHTRCYGGPGHCADPLSRRSRFDQRPLHHHEPRNFRLDVTDTAQRLIAEGAESLSVQVVVVGLDGKPNQNALYLDGVSLNFFD